MTLLDRDKERLFFSVFLSCLLFILLYFFLDLFIKLPLTPFPETTTLLLLDLQTDQFLGETERKETVTPLSPPIKEVLPPTPEPQTTPQRAPSVPSSPMSKNQPPQPVPRGSTGDQTVEPRVERSPYPLRSEPIPPTPPRIQPYTPSETRDPAIAEREFLQAEMARLETWLREHAPQPSPSSVLPVPKVEQTPSTPVDSSVQKVTEQLEVIKRRLEQLQAASSTPQKTQQEGKEPFSQEPLKPIYDREGREIGRGELKGRVPMFPLNMGRILPEDFEGFPIQNLELRAEFLIGESGLLEPGSLKIFGDSRYTRIVEKVRSALEKWRFDSRPGMRTPAVIHFLIKVRGM
ncbi:MAG: hypothetical protein N2442_11260 [Spirochaetes bacterium]|nr:hypothetical protein [Spirochaetota bacterium]